MDVDGIDKGLRRVLAIQMMPFGDNLSKLYEEICLTTEKVYTILT